MRLEPHTPTVTEPEPAEKPRRYRWYQKLSSMLLILFCLEIGCFLLVFPWLGDVWQNNFFSSLLRQGYWDNPYFRGAVSGLGVVNLYICFVEIFRLRRFW
ncbi:MAG TPA: hypothetical protein VLX58_00670 [Bryobacteraceae bacterium]|nr:hypothetical protein [Bryobacteraceae bacterium]